MEAIMKNVKTIPSYEVAKMMEREHKEVMYMIDGNKKRGIVGIKPTLEISAELHLSDYFIKNTYKDSMNREKEYYECTKMGCELLANKMTGEKGILFTAKYVKKFNEMEEAKLPQIDVVDEAILKIAKAGMNDELQIVVKDQMQQLAEKFGRILATEIDGENRIVTLEEIAIQLTDAFNIFIISGDITSYLRYKGYLRDQIFPSRQNPNRPERQSHKQPTEKFIIEVVNTGRANTKTDYRGKIIINYTNRFVPWFIATHKDGFIEWMKNRLY